MATILYAFLVACEPQKVVRTPGHRSVGKYIYCDDNDIYHVDPNCRKLRHGKDDAGHDIYAKHLVDTSKFMIADCQQFRVCAICVSDSAFEKMVDLSQQNDEKMERNASIQRIFDNRHFLYEQLVSDYEMPSFEVFDRNLSILDTRKRIFEIATSEKYLIERGQQFYVYSFEEFSEKLGF